MVEKEEVTSWKAQADPATGQIRLTGEIDFTNSPAVRDWLRSFIINCNSDITLDLADLEYIDSSGLAVLIAARKLMKAKNLSIRVSAASSQVQKLFSLTQIGELFGV